MPTIKEIVDLLEETGALQLGESPWEQINNDPIDIHNVDWDRLYPTRRPIEQGNSPWELYGDEWEIDDDTLDEVLSPIDNEEGDSVPRNQDWDICAWYQPIHFHGHDWGIFIREDCMRMLARRIYSELNILHPIHLSSRQSAELFVKALLRTSFSAYYHHELYHHKMECFGLRLQAVERKGAYSKYFKNVYIPSKGTDELIEEALANAHMYRNIGRLSWIPSIIADAARHLFEKTFYKEPPGYRLAPNYLSNQKFESGQHNLFCQLQEGVLTPIKNPVEWLLGPRLNHSFFNIKSDIWTVVPLGTKSIIPTTATPIRTCSTADMLKVCLDHGYITTHGGKGSHVKLKKPGAPMIILPGDRNNLSPGVARAVLNILGGYRIQDLPNLI